MTIYCQRDYPDQLGSCNTTIAREGCAITSCGMLADTPPPDVNRLGCYSNGCLANWECLAGKLKLDYNSRRDVAVRYPCIAEVVLSGVQHFIVLKDENTQIDPWTGKEDKLSYQVLSYRNLTPKENNIMPFNDTEVRNMVNAVIHDFLGYEPTGSQTDGHMNAIKERQKEPEDYALSEFVHDRFKEMKPKDCTNEIKTATKDLQDESIKEMKEHEEFAKTMQTKLETMQKSLDDTTVALQSANATSTALNTELKRASDEINKLKKELEGKCKTTTEKIEVEYCGILNYFMKFFKKGDK